MGPIFAASRITYRNRLSCHCLHCLPLLLVPVHARVLRSFPMLRISIEHIASLAGVSVGTVDRALHGRKGIKEETRQRVLEIANGVGYETHWAARALACGRANIRIGVCIPREFRLYYAQIRDGILDEVKRSKSLGIEVDYHPVEKYGSGEIDAVRQLRAERVDAIVMTPADPMAVAPEISAAEEGGIRVVCVASDARESSRSAIVCVQPELNGSLAAELLAKFTPPSARVAIIAGILSAEDQQAKTRGFTTAFRQWCQDGEVVEVVEGHDDEEETFHVAFDLLNRHPELSGIYVSNAMGIPVCRVLRERRMAGRTKLVATDLYPQMAQFFENGAITASIHQRPYRQGQVSVRLIVDHLIHGMPILATNYLNPSIVFRSNLHLFREMRHTGPATEWNEQTIMVGQEHSS